MGWGDADGKTLYLCARAGLYRIRLNIAGILAADLSRRTQINGYSRQSAPSIALKPSAIYGYRSFFGHISYD